MTLRRDEAELYAGWFRCLADPTRIMILTVLASESRPLSVGEIVARADVGQSTVSHHLAVLSETEFVVAERRGNATLFRVNEECLESFPAAARLVMGRLARPDVGATPRRAPWQASGTARRGRRMARTPSRKLR